MLLKTLFLFFFINIIYDWIYKKRVNSLNQITHILDDFPASKFFKITHSDEKKRKWQRRARKERKESGGKKTDISFNFQTCMPTLAYGGCVRSKSGSQNGAGLPWRHNNSLSSQLTKTKTVLGTELIQDIIDEQQLGSWERKTATSPLWFRFCKFSSRPPCIVAHSRWRTDMWLEIRDCKLEYSFVIGIWRLWDREKNNQITLFSYMFLWSK